eukprot:g5398.t1
MAPPWTCAARNPIHVSLESVAMMHIRINIDHIVSNNINIIPHTLVVLVFHLERVPIFVLRLRLQDEMASQQRFTEAMFKFGAWRRP